MIRDYCRVREIKHWLFIIFVELVDITDFNAYNTFINIIRDKSITDGDEINSISTVSKSILSNCTSFCCVLWWRADARSTRLSLPPYTVCLAPYKVTIHKRDYLFSAMKKA